MILFKAEQAMHLKHHKIGFSVPNRTAPTYIFLHFINPVTIYLNDQEINTPPNTCIIFSPGSNLHYQAKKITMLHNFLHFTVTDEKRFKEFNLPLDRLFYTNLQTEITDAIEYVELYTVKKFEGYENTIDGLISDIFDALAKEQHRRISFNVFSSKARFDNLRSEIYQKPGDWSVEKMAKYLNLSRSRFSTKYRNIFGVTPNKDLNDAAMLYANKMLMTSDICISDLAYECGYTSPDYFIRLYKKYYGTTPGAYRKSLRDSQNLD